MASEKKSKQVGLRWEHKDRLQTIIDLTKVIDWLRFGDKGTYWGYNVDPAVAKVALVERLEKFLKEMREVHNLTTYIEQLEKGKRVVKKMKAKGASKEEIDEALDDAGLDSEEFDPEEIEDEIPF